MGRIIHRLCRNENEFYADLEKELLHYDLQRTEIFGWVHAMENYLFEQHPELGKKDKMEEGSHYYYAQKVKNKKTGEEETKYSPIRQNFRAMLNVPGNIPSRHLEALVEIRNSSCHNLYVEDLNVGTYPSADIPDHEPLVLDLKDKNQGERAAVFQYNYPVFTDDFRFRMDPGRFEKLRSEYKYRREIRVE